MNAITPIITAATGVCPCCGQTIRKPRAKAAKVAAMTAEEFFDARVVACRAVAADVGENWHLVAGASFWCAIPSKLRSFTTARGTRIKCRPDARLPAGQYWPAGALPDGVIVGTESAPDPIRRARAMLMSAEMHERATRHAIAHQSRTFRRNYREEYRKMVREAWDARRVVRNLREVVAA